MDVLAKIRYYMDKKKWTEYRLSQEANIPQSTLNSLFRKNNNPTISTLQAMCNAFGITLSEFFAEGTNENDLTLEQREMLKKLQRLNVKQREAIYNLIDSI